MILLLAANRGDFIVEIRSPKRESNVVKIRHVTICNIYNLPIA